MSVQFGRCNWEGRPLAPDYMDRFRVALAPYGPDSNEQYSSDGIDILYRAFRTTRESYEEAQPHKSSSGTIITWDGRLDNRAELINEFRDVLETGCTDLAIVAAAYEKWGARSFARLVGDWALSVWTPNDRSLILARDPIGTHRLYYSLQKDLVTWCTLLEPLVTLAGKTFDVCEEYVAGWFSNLPSQHLTPYVGILAVPPSSFAHFRQGKYGLKHIVSKFWDFDATKEIRYRSDAEYEEHFRGALATAVKRRLRSDRPVLAELSGGMDSSSIVCVADIIIAQGAAETPRLDTISWYDDSYDHIDPDWNERPYFSKVEEKRGRIGCHINTRSLTDFGFRQPFTSQFEGHCLAATPNSTNLLSQLFEQYAAHVKSVGYRITLSGLGGDDVTGGGVPSPTPELQDLLARLRVFKFTRQLKAWAAKMKKSRSSLLWEAVRGFFPGGETPLKRHPAPWFHPDFVRRNRQCFYRHSSSLEVFGVLRSFQDNIAALKDSQNRLGDWNLHREMVREVRFPYLDRDLLEFAYAIPREQLVRVGQRRSLMKRALVGIVPHELLKRRRTGFVPHKFRREASAELPSSDQIGQHIVSGSIGIINPIRFLEELQKARQGAVLDVNLLMRTLTLESWLRHLTVQGLLANATLQIKGRQFSPLEASRTGSAISQELS